MRLMPVQLCSRWRLGAGLWFCIGRCAMGGTCDATPKLQQRLNAERWRCVSNMGGARDACATPAACDMFVVQKDASVAVGCQCAACSGMSRVQGYSWHRAKREQERQTMMCNLLCLERYTAQPSLHGMMPHKLCSLS